MKFDKPALSFDQQLDRLIDRGMIVSERAEATHYLAHLNYYRLGAYWLPFEQDHETHSFKPNTQFSSVLNLYVFDRELRLLVLDAIERIEISLRTGWAYHISHRHGPHAHLDASLFKNTGRGWDHQKQLDKLKDSAKRNKKAFIQHYHKTYEEALPPLWVIVEIMTLGELSRWYSNMKHGQDRNLVAQTYDMDEINLVSFLHHLSIVRNVCAHHSRLWNREFTFTFKLPQRKPASLFGNFNQGGKRKIYNTLVMLGYMMDIISPDHHWKIRLNKLIEQHGIDVAAMGFPDSWQSLAVWKK